MSTQFNFGSVPTLTTSSANAFTFATQSTPLPTLSSLTTTTAPFSMTTTPMVPMVPNQTLTLTLTTVSTAVTQPSAQTTDAFHGLGGTQTTSSESGADHSLNQNKSNKETTFIPPEMVPLVEALKQFVKQQKAIREENSQQRFSIQPILEVGAQIEDNLRVLLHKIEVDIQRNSKAMDGLKRDTNKLLSSAEMAYRISRVDVLQTPSSYTDAQNKYINASTHQYFIDTIDNFSLQMNVYSKQIQELRTHIDNMNKPYSSEELFQIMRKQHETLISLAAKVYAIHEDINQLKLKLKNQSNYSSKLVENTFESSKGSPSLNQSFVGPNPFGLTGEESVFAAQLQSSQPLNTTNIGAGNPSLFPTLTPMSTPSSTFQYSPSTTASSTSHSRAKRWTTS